MGLCVRVSLALALNIDCLLIIRSNCQTSKSQQTKKDALILNPPPLNNICRVKSGLDGLGFDIYPQSSAYSLLLEQY
jgi:hypothetical protein